MRNHVSLARRQASRLRVLKFGAIALLVICAAILGVAAVNGAVNHDPGISLASLPFLAVGGMMFREKPDDSGGGGAPESLGECPAIVGETPEAKLQSAGGIITSLWDRIKKATSDLASKTKAYLELEGTSSQLKKDLQAEKEGHVATKGLLETEQKNHKETSGKLTKSEERVGHLEGLCKLKGLDPDAVVPAAPAPEALQTAEDWSAKLAAAKTPEAQHQVLVDFQKAVSEGKVKKA